MPNPSIERTHNGGAQCLAPSRVVPPLCAAHVKRYGAAIRVGVHGSLESFACIAVSRLVHRRLGKSESASNQVRVGAEPNRAEARKSPAPIGSREMHEGQVVAAPDQIAQKFLCIGTSTPPRQAAKPDGCWRFAPPCCAGQSAS